MARISVVKSHVRSLAPHQIQELLYPQRIINDILLIQQEEEPRYVIQHDTNDAYIQVPTNDYMPDSDESLFTIAEFDFPDNDSSTSSESHDSWESIAYPKDLNPYTDLPDHTIIQDVTDESHHEDDIPDHTRIQDIIFMMTFI